MIGHIHLDKHIFSILSIKVMPYGVLLFILFYSDCVHIYINYLIFKQKNSKGWL
jgi:hypothetical protein